MSLRFGAFELNLDRYQLTASGRPIEVQPKVLELLGYLIENRDRMVPREELLEKVWKRVNVSDSALSRSVSEARKAPRRGGGERGWITTVYGRGFRFTGPPLTEDAPPSEPGAETAVRSAPSAPVAVAVLPFADFSPEGGQAYFCEGLAEEILNRLARLPELRIVARGVSFQFQPDSDPREVGRELGVSYVLAGTVRREVRELRIAAELTDTGSGFRIWSQQWHRAQQQVLAVQEQIAAEVLEALDVRFAGIRLERAARPRQPRSADAYDHYLRGRALFMEGRRTTYYEARRHYKAALDIDPEYALAYAGLADCLSYLYLFHELSESHRVSAEEASAKAIELAPEVAESHAARALALDTYARDDEAEHHFRRALELDPKSFEASYHFARHCFRRGRFEEALELFRRAADADPTAYAPCDLAAGISVSLGDHSGGAAWRQQCLERVERRLERYPGDQRAILFGGVGLAAQGDKKRALRWLRRAEEIDPEDPVALYNMACAATLCDEVDLGLDFLERAIAAGFPDLSWIESDSELDPLRSAPRYADVIAPLRERERERKREKPSDRSG